MSTMQETEGIAGQNMSAPESLDLALPLTRSVTLGNSFHFCELWFSVK